MLPNIAGGVGIVVPPAVVTPESVWSIFKTPTRGSSNVYAMMVSFKRSERRKIAGLKNKDFQQNQLA
jgi:hypothetical protein